MKIGTGILVALALFCLSANAQTDAQTAVYDTPQGQVIVHSGQPPAKDFGPAPAFNQLDRRGAGYITSEDAEAYPPLANDFLHADTNRDGRITRAEYERWLRSH